MPYTVSGQILWILPSSAPDSYVQCLWSKRDRLRTTNKLLDGERSGSGIAKHSRITRAHSTCRNKEEEEKMRPKPHPELKEKKRSLNVLLDVFSFFVLKDRAGN